MKVSRRSITRWILGAPVAAAAASALPAALLGAPSALAGQAAPAAEPAPADRPVPPSEPEETPLARFLAKNQEGLTSAERARIRRKVSDLEQSLAAIRSFRMGNDVPPAGSFRALRSKRS